MNEITSQPVCYKSFLLRIRYFFKEGEPAQQAMLQEVSSGEQHHFTDLDSLQQFLEVDPQADNQNGQNRNGGSV